MELYRVVRPKGRVVPYAICAAKKCTGKRTGLFSSTVGVGWAIRCDLDAERVSLIEMVAVKP